MLSILSKRLITPPNPHPELLPETLDELQINILVVIYVFEALAICAVGLRIYCRLKRLKRLFLTDWLLIVALLLQIVVQVLNIYEMLETLRSFADYHPATSYTVDAIFITFVVFWAMRMSISLLFLEIFSEKRTKYVVYIFMAIVTISSLTSVIFLLSYCIPLMSGTVENLFAGCSYQSLIAMELACATGLLFDCAAVILPIIPIWRLRMSLTKKISVTVIFMLGWLTIASSTIRLYIATKLLLSGPQPPGEISNFTIFAAVELHTGLIASSLIACWGDIRRWLKPIKKRITNFFRGGEAKEKGKLMDTSRSDSIWSRLAGWRKNRESREKEREKRRPSVMSTTRILESTRGGTAAQYGVGTLIDISGEPERKPSEATTSTLKAGSEHVEDREQVAQEAAARGATILKDHVSDRERDASDIV